MVRSRCFEDAPDDDDQPFAGVSLRVGTVSHDLAGKRLQRRLVRNPPPPCLFLSSALGIGRAVGKQGFTRLFEFGYRAVDGGGVVLQPLRNPGAGDEMVPRGPETIGPEPQHTFPQRE